MFEKLGLGSHEVVIEMIVRKLGHNLRHWAEDSEIIKETLEIFTELVAGYSSGRLMLKLDTVKFIMGHHTEEHFPFLTNPENERHRSTFYTALAKLLFLHNSPAHFDEFMSPFLVKLQQLGDPRTVPDAVLRGADGRARMALVGVCRDLRGMARATHNSRTYTLLFEALYPAAFPALQRAATLFADDPGVSIALLRFCEEFVHNKSSRIYFDHCSPNGILLFRKTSEIAAAYVARRVFSRVVCLAALALTPPCAPPPPPPSLPRRAGTPRNRLRSTLRAAPPGGARRTRTSRSSRGSDSASRCSPAHSADITSTSASLRCTATKRSTTRSAPHCSSPSPSRSRT
jgi:hypothetical protein